MADHFLEEATSFLKRVTLFSEIEESTLRELAKKLKPYTLSKGATLYREGEPADALYIIQSGRVRLLAIGEDGKEKTVSIFGRGDTFGETSLLTGAPHSLTVKVDSTAHFLVLHREDFENYIKKNPTAAFCLSRLLSRRLLMATKRIYHESSSPELIGIAASLPKEDWITFLVNLGLSVTEQTKRKVLLLDLSPFGAELIRSIGLVPIRTAGGMLQPEDLRDPRVLERIITCHASGLELMTLTEDAFTGILFGSIIPFLDTLRNMYDIVLVCLHSTEGNGHTSGNGSNEIERTLLGECDTLFFVSEDASVNFQYLRFTLDQKLNGPGPVKKRILLKKQNTLLHSGSDFVVPWDDCVTSAFRKGERPYLIGIESDQTFRAISRIARYIGRVQVGLAIGSGAAYGYTAIGMLKVFEREKIPIDYISGTSMGALLGSFFAMGKTADEIEEIAGTITKTWIRRNFLSDLNLPWPHGGLLMGITVARFLKSILGEREFKDLSIPFSCVATDILTGDPVYLNEGRVWEAVRASLSLPLIFRPYKMGNRYLVDGGIVNPVPTAVLANMGANILISISLTNKVSERRVALRRIGMFPSKSPGIFNVFFKMLYTMQEQISSARTDLSHVTIHPNTRNFSWLDFHKAKQIIPAGEEAAIEALPRIKALLPYFSDHCKVPVRFHSSV